MTEKIIAALMALSVTGKYVVVFVLMAVQSACIPIPSEVIMPFAGATLAHSQMQLILLATIASLASNLGSIPAYWVGAKGGRPMVERYGSWLLPVSYTHLVEEVEQALVVLRGGKLDGCGRRGCGGRLGEKRRQP